MIDIKISNWIIKLKDFDIEIQGFEINQALNDIRDFGVKIFGCDIKVRCNVLAMCNGDIWNVPTPPS